MDAPQTVVLRQCVCGIQIEVHRGSYTTNDITCVTQIRLIALTSIHQWVIPCHMRVVAASLSDNNFHSVNVRMGDSLKRRHNERGGFSNHQPHDCSLNGLFKRSSKKTSKLRVIGLGVGNSTVTGEFPTQRTSNAENVSIWWRHHVSSESAGVGWISATFFFLGWHKSDHLGIFH